MVANVANVIPISDELLLDCPNIAGAMARSFWYMYWRELRTRRNRAKHLRLIEQGIPVYHVKRRDWAKPDYSDEEYEGL